MFKKVEENRSIMKRNLRYVSESNVTFGYKNPPISGMKTT